jgi:hypothetical protein
LYCRGRLPGEDQRCRQQFCCLAVIRAKRQSPLKALSRVLVVILLQEGKPEVEVKVRIAGSARECLTIDPHGIRIPAEAGVDDAEVSQGTLVAGAQLQEFDESSLSSGQVSPREGLRRLTKQSPEVGRGTLPGCKREN